MFWGEATLSVDWVFPTSSAGREEKDVIIGPGTCCNKDNMLTRVLGRFKDEEYISDIQAVNKEYLGGMFSLVF